MRSEGGFSYLIVLFLVAALSIAAVKGLENTMTRERRDKETELLWRGMAYREAIRRFYEGGPGSLRTYPQELGDLLQDRRLIRTVRPLRKLYRDPISPSGEWALIRNEAGAIIGVRSLSNVKPIKQAGFAPELAHFAGAQHYSDWTFIYVAK
jgi:hypothetical protein